jgi:hypothetical protein
MKVTSYFEGTYPNITRWLTHGWIEIGEVEYSESFIRALDEGGMVWEGEESYQTIDQALQDLEAGLEEIIKDFGI